jgi:hypothetical protein
MTILICDSVAVVRFSIYHGCSLKEHGVRFSCCLAGDEYDFA